MMKNKSLKLPIVIISVAVAVAIVGCLFAGIVMKPTITEHDFTYSVTYKLDGEVKTFEGVYRCKFLETSPYGRMYSGEFMDYGLAQHSLTYTIAQKDGFDLGIVMSFHDSTLMGDTKNDYFDHDFQDPHLAVHDREGYCYEGEEMPDIFDAEIISWKYPEPIENTLVFAGFCELYEVSMLIMGLSSFLALLACMIFVKKDESVVYGPYDRLGVVLNFAIALVVSPFLTLVCWIGQMFATGPNWIYQGFYVVPMIITLSLAASISLRRKGYAKSGFFIQLAGIAVFAVLAGFETIL